MLNIDATLIEIELGFSEKWNQQGGERENEREIYYKELNHMIMEAEKPQDLQSSC